MNEKKHYTVKSPQGLHARIVASLSKIANQYDNDIYMMTDNVTIDLKSVIGVMSLGLAKGESFSILVEGMNSETIHKTLQKALKDHQII